MSIFAPLDTFSRRHIGPNAAQRADMLKTAGLESMEHLEKEIVPGAIRLNRALKLAPGRGEAELLAELKSIASQNKVARSFLGQGYYGTHTPGVILRNITENPGWYTSYTPYQAEISQGRMESLLNFQTMVGDITGLPYTNASLLDEATAAAEALSMTIASTEQERSAYFVADDVHPQTLAVIKGRAEPLNIKVHIGRPDKFDFKANPVCGALVQYPTTYGFVEDYSAFAKRVHDSGALVVCATDLLALTLLKPPGEWGADIAVGSAQRFGVPLGYGGPHAGFLATGDARLQRKMPGRIIGVSKDSRGEPALRMALQTREQHIRRDKATSNICTAQALLANMAAMYAVYHGPEGLRKIATRTHQIAGVLRDALQQAGHDVSSSPFFDTLHVFVRGTTASKVAEEAAKRNINIRVIDAQRVGLSMDETVTEQDVHNIVAALTPPGAAVPKVSNKAPASAIPANLQRKSAFLTNPVFNSHHSEHEMLRYIHKLETKDLSLNTSMIPLGSCTMKLNATSEMIPVTWPEFNAMHPFAPLNQAIGYQKMFRDVENVLAEITGFHSVTLQPNAGSAGEYTGLLVIRAYLKSIKQPHRNICLIPTSAHGTNPASAVMAGMKVVPVKCNEANGYIDVEDLRAKAQEHKDKLACVMVTYPSTYGVFEETIKDICSIVHSNGGQVYMDGANMNAQVGLCRPGDIGADVCHLNLHKTFCVSAGTPVALPGGVTRPIEQMVEGTSVYGWSESENGVRGARLEHVFNTGKKRCVQVTLQDGRTIVCTPDHRVLTTEGWVEAGKLDSSQHRVVMGPELPADASDDMEANFHAQYGDLVLRMHTAPERERTLAFFRLLGATCSDGTFSASDESGRLRTRIPLYLGTHYDACRVVSDVHLLTGATPTISLAHSAFAVNLPDGLTQCFAHVPWMGEPGRRIESERTLPDVVGLPLAALREFLGGLFGGDGCAPVIVHQIKNPATFKPVKFVQTHKEPAVLAVTQSLLCEALARFGVEAEAERIAEVPPGHLANQAQEPRWSGQVAIVDGLQFAERIGFRYCAHKTTRLSAAAAFWRMKQTIHDQRVEVATRALAGVNAHGSTMTGPIPVWSTAVDGAFQELSSECPVLNRYYASFAGTKHVSKQVLVEAIGGQMRGGKVQRSHRRMLVSPIGRGGEKTGVPELKEFLAEIGALGWFNEHTTEGSDKITYAMAQDAVVEPTFHLRVVDVRDIGEREVYDLTVNQLHSFVANGAVVHNCIPHGGGGPGIGPIGVAKHLAPFLPSHPTIPTGSPSGTAIEPVSAAPWGSSSIVPITWMYLHLMGAEGLKDATLTAILNANYMKARLQGAYKVAFTSKKGFVAHEFIVDLREFKESAGVEAEDVAKRLMDYNFHAPTMSWPVTGTLMIEPTESESKAELDRFCDAMLEIRKEIQEIIDGKADRKLNVLKGAPHTADMLLSDKWNRPYPREKAAYPLAYVRNQKFWPSVGRLDNVYGDKNLVCSCPSDWAEKH